MPRQTTTLSVSQFVSGRTPARHAEIGQIWWAECSIREAVLAVAKNASVVAPISTAMMTEYLTRYYNNDDKKARPCIIVRKSIRAGQFLVIPLGTFDGIPIGNLDSHTQHLAVSVGLTRPWPSRDSHVIRPQPSWPLSRTVACYAISNTISIPVGSLVTPYTWPVPSPHAAPPGQATLPREPEIRAFNVDHGEIKILTDLIKKRKRRYEGKSGDELRRMHANFDASSRGGPQRAQGRR